MAPAVVESRVIPNGVDLDVFCQGDRAAARAKLNLPQEADILLFTASSIRKNVWKDYQTLRGAIARLADRPLARPLIFLGVGETAPNEKIGDAEIRFVPFLEENRRVINNHLTLTGQSKASYTHVIAYALVHAIKQFPRMNAAFIRLRSFAETSVC